MPHVLPPLATRSTTAPVPRLPGFDHTLAWLADPYRFIARGCATLGADAFQTRLLLRPTICMSGPLAAELFYDESRFLRAGAAPEPLKATLFGRDGVQTLDGDAHRVRKALLVGLTGADSVRSLIEIAGEEWDRAAAGWAGAPHPVTLYREVQPLLARAACRCAGVPLPEAEVARRTRQLVALFDEAAAGPVAHLRARWARSRAEAWLMALVEDARAGRVALPPGCAAQVIAAYRDLDGRPLPVHTAAVELLNLLRPVVAVSVWISFVAHALQRFPAWRATLASPDGENLAPAFIDEIRRHYPFFPAIVARVREDFDWCGLHFPAGRRVLLDVFGTHHDPRIWREPQAFLPERWLQRRPGPYEFLPQGGGDVAGGHRCPGEDLAAQLMRLALGRLSRMRVIVPPQVMALKMSRLPAVPVDGIRLRVLDPG
ncbi:MAG: cytochrome P450 [Rubrivivax sp.]